MNNPRPNKYYTYLRGAVDVTLIVGERWLPVLGYEGFYEVSSLKFGAKGEAHPRALLNDDAVRSIRQKFHPRVYTRQMLAREFGVKPRTIKAVLSGQLWGHVT